jgi:hypothetical protein
MDEIIQNKSCSRFNDLLNYCPELDLLYQRDNQIIRYDKDYFEKYVGYKASDIANKINLARCTLTERYCRKSIIDVGIGSGEFIERSNLKVYGYDINPYAIRWLRERNLYLDFYNSEIPEEVEGWSLWDTLEHIPKPSVLLNLVPKNRYVFLSIPIFDTFKNIEQHKHYKPREHLYYFTHDGLIKYFAEAKFILMETNTKETEAGRYSIGSYAFRKS